MVCGFNGFSELEGGGTYYKILSMLVVKLSIKRPPSNAWAAWLVAEQGNLTIVRSKTA